jgi:hypothetical protein
MLTWTNEGLPRCLSGTHLSGILSQSGAHMGDADQSWIATWHNYADVAQSETAT